MALSMLNRLFSFNWNASSGTKQVPGAPTVLPTTTMPASKAPKKPTLVPDIVPKSPVKAAAGAAKPAGSTLLTAAPQPPRSTLLGQ